MEIPALKGIIARRILLNYRCEAETLQKLLPPPFRPKLHADYAIAGVCLIRLEKIRPAIWPLPCGLSSENAAHRIAVLWNDATGQTCEGVFIPRRDTGAKLTQWTGGKLFPGEHHGAAFQVKETTDTLSLRMQSHDGRMQVRVAGTIGAAWPQTSCFASLDEASAFFESGSLGYSVRRDSPDLDGLTLQTQQWHVENLAISEAFSSFFADGSRFPVGTAQFDHALLMRGIAHEWHAAPPLKRTESAPCL